MNIKINFGAFYILLLLTIFSCTSRHKKIEKLADNIELNKIGTELITYEQKCAKCEKFILKIDIKKDKQSISNITVNYETLIKKIDTTFSISKIQFENIANSVEKISPKDIVFSEGGIDGTESIIEFGNCGNIVRYSVWSPKYDIDGRKLNDFVKSCELILELAGFNSSEIL